MTDDTLGITSRDGDAVRLERIRWNWRNPGSVFDAEVPFLLQQVDSRDAALREARAEMEMYRNSLKETQDALIAARADIERLRNVCAEGYQVIGAIAHYAGFRDSDDVVRAFDNMIAAAGRRANTAH